MESLILGSAASFVGNIKGKQQPEVERHVKREDAAPHSPQTSRLLEANSEGRSDESMRNADCVLQSKHKIFLSHSGAQKDLVDLLCDDLEKHHRFPFFDQRSSSLPKGERFPTLILKAAQECQLAIVVVSEEYFLSKWPMIELHAFVQARLTSNTKLKILPLFYGLSVQEFGNNDRRARWFNTWEEWAKIDLRINIQEWKESLKVLASFNGIEYNQGFSRIGAYLKTVVSNICKEVGPDIKWDDSHVQGRLSICQAIQERIKQIQSANKSEVCVIGFYGVGGIGKTTICKTLCNELLEEFEGKVSHVELGSESSTKLLKGVLKDLTNTSQELLQQLNEGECKYLLHKDTCKQRTFLAVDNVWDDSLSMEGAKMYLQTPFHEKSVVMVTSRSLETLTSLGISVSDCFEMPKLEHEDAKALFLYHATHGKQFSDYEDQRSIRKCVSLCYFSNGDQGSCHYLPLALKALGVQLSCIGDKPSQWLKILPKVKSFNYFEEEHNPVFSILRSSFDRLQPIDQCLFMDVVMYKPMRRPDIGNLDLSQWLSCVYNEDHEEIESRLWRLKAKGLLEYVDMNSQTIRVHDLYREFAKLESQGKLDKSANFGTRKWVWYEDAHPAELELTPFHGCWQNLTRIATMKKSWPSWHIDRNLEGIEWRYCSNVVVLKLDGLKKLQGDLNLAALKCLRSLDLVDITALDSLEGLQDLRNLTYFRWVQDFNSVTQKPCTCKGKLPSSLKVLQLCVGVLWLRPDIFDNCTNLSKLELYNCAADSLDFSNCLSLQSVVLCSLRSLRTFTGLFTTVSRLQVSCCEELVEIPGLSHLVSLKELHLYGNHRLLKLLDLQRLTKLQVLSIHEMKLLGLGLGSLRQLRKLECTKWPTPTKIPNFSGFEQLQVVDFSGSRVTSLEGVFTGNLSSLRCLILRDCTSLRRLPDLSDLRSLEELDLGNSGISLQDEDIRMLAALPLLQPVVVGTRRDSRLDVVKRKVLKWVGASEDQYYQHPPESWLSWTKWEERNLRSLPLEVRSMGW
ncbi:hypothetical protein M758_7G152900 [Ceratodon purpureus]|nr:hypothetical protein M758_7G152900 [Ceratodon purpureus]KAG0611618.1 hypothetical protein M758_7G152900 [Ceratodon purpureus]